MVVQGYASGAYVFDPHRRRPQAHDIATSSELADQVAVMYAGQLVEISDAARFFRESLHPYSQKLMLEPFFRPWLPKVAPFAIRLIRICSLPRRTR